METNRELSNRLRELRIRLHRSQMAMGQLVGVSRQRWSLFETEYRIPTVTQIADLALACGVSTDWLILGKGDPP